MAYSLTVGSSAPLRAYGDVAASYTFLSVDPKVASVDAGGNVTAVGPGRVAILMIRKSDLALRRVSVSVKGASTGSAAAVIDASGNHVAVAPFVLKVNNKVYGGTHHFKELRMAPTVVPPAGVILSSELVPYLSIVNQGGLPAGTYSVQLSYFPAQDGYIDVVDQMWREGTPEKWSIWIHSSALSNSTTNEEWQLWDTNDPHVLDIFQNSPSVLLGHVEVSLKGIPSYTDYLNGTVTIN